MKMTNIRVFVVPRIVVLFAFFFDVHLHQRRRRLGMLWVGGGHVWFVKIMTPGIFKTENAI
jgi:hypothetical protein